LRNAVLVYRRDHATWPQRLEDVESLIYEPQRLGRVTFTDRQDGGLDVSFAGRAGPASTIAEMLEERNSATFTVYADGTGRAVPSNSSARPDAPPQRE
jgi:hypothetical protein